MQATLSDRLCHESGGSQSGVTEDSGLLGCDAASYGERPLLGALDSSKAVQSHPVVYHHIPDDLNP